VAVRKKEKGSREKTMNVLIAGGGTGGHLFPGIALAEEVVSHGSEHRVLFVGTNRGLEAKAVPHAGFELDCIEVGGLKGKGWKGWLRGMLQIPKAMVQSWKILRRFQPDVVVGVGGYASGPALLTAVFMRLPTVILEQNALPGFTNRILGKVAKKVVVAFPESVPFFKRKKVLVLGNPVRRTLIQAVSHRQGEQGNCLLVFGGSQGAAAINRIMPDVVRLVREKVSDLQVVHQTGERDLDGVKEHYRALGLKAEVLPFIHDMAAAYQRAGCVVSRAGATTVAELSVCKKPAVLVPFPFAADNHQEVNARALVNAGAAVMIRESELTPDGLAGEVVSILTNAERRSKMEAAAGQASRPESAREIFNLCMGLSGGSNRQNGENS
jgi:UDP-N-acetylglucosamine--N-acetylmuramyl-(pentapeptide) pyrophosphoryl-undecaprenol N-acetylglucosamine transferase